VGAKPDAGRDTSTPIRRAIEFGIDLTLLLENLKYAPTERVRRAQRTLDSLVAFDAEVAASRQRRRQRP
jgi:hypothetical protein